MPLTTAMPLPAALPAAIPSPSWSGFSIGPFTVHAYALCILLGIVLALWMTSVRWRRRGAPEGALWDVAIWAIPAGIIGGRLYHVFSSPDAYFGPHGDLALIPQIWRGGLGIWGAVALGALGAWIGCRRAGLRLTTFVDAAAPAVLLAQAIGRWGNWFNQELFGAPTTLPWGLQIDPTSPNFPPGLPADTLFQPTFLYEFIWDLLGVAILLMLDRRFRFRRARLFWLYAAFYTLGRAWIEMLRIDDAEHILGLRLNVWTSGLVFIAAVVIFIVLGLTDKERSRSAWLPGKEPAVEDEALETNKDDDDGARPGADSSPGAGQTGAGVTKDTPAAQKTDSGRKTPDATITSTNTEASDRSGPGKPGISTDSGS